MGLARLGVPDDRFQYLHEAALRALVLHMPGEVYPGPYTYKRFWVRDTAFIMNAALCVGMHARAKNALPHLLARQNARGYFHSQDGEWDSNGQALWLLERYSQLANVTPPTDWGPIISSAADWIRRKRLPSDSPHPAKGLMPAGFSAEHLGPNDYYYWDDFWSIAGLEAGARLIQTLGRSGEAARLLQESQSLQLAVAASLERTDDLRRTIAYPGRTRTTSRCRSGWFARGYLSAAICSASRRTYATHA